MKINMPITDVEQVMKDGDILVSTTDLKGAITFVNRAFIEISGFNEAELMRKSHSIVRHPDMPSAAFKDLWDTVKKGKPWTGLVKNRVKNGDFYWVVANVIPIKKNGQIVEYMSVRTKPTRDEIKQAEAIYQAMNSEKPPKTGIFSRFAQGYKNTGLKIKLTMLSLLVAAVLTTGGIEEYHEMTTIGDAWTHYQDNIVERLSLSNEIRSAFGYGGITQQFSDYNLQQNPTYYNDFGNSYDKLTTNINLYKQLPDLSSSELTALNTISDVALQYNNSINNIQALFQQDLPLQQLAITSRIDASPAMTAISSLEVSYQQLAQASSNNLNAHLEDSIIGIILERIISFTLICVLAGFALSLSILRPIKQLIQVFNNINEGRYENKFDIRSNNEFGRLFQALYVTQTKLNFDIQESRLTAEEALRIKNALDNVTANVMVVDSQRNIIYMNDSVQATLTNAQESIQQDLPQFSANDLLGENLDIFALSPLFQQQTLEGLTATHKAEITLGDRIMDITLNPVMSADKERLGTAIEWVDKTAEVAIEKEIDALVAAAANGDLSKRLAVEGKNEFFSKLSLGLNNLLSSSSAFIDDLGQLFARLAEGDLTQSIEQQYHGEFNKIKEDANNTVAKLTNIINQINSSADTVRTAAHEIALGNTDLSQRTEEQACSLEQTASSMEEITATIKQSSDNTVEANQLANDAKNKAQNGGKTVQDAVAAMKDILTASHRINDIIAVIDEIAFQTNLLALNAAVEAARAGEQGRGFAVVAGEVRNLSQRSADAAKEIKDLIRDSVDKVNVGSALVNDSGETLKEIVHSVEHVASMITEISNAAKEQSSGIEQINQAVTQMDEVTQQNSSLVEQASVASSAMSDQVNHMSELIQFFKVEQDNYAPLDNANVLNRQSLAMQQSQQEKSPKLSNKPFTEKRARANDKALAALSNDDDWDSF